MHGPFPGAAKGPYIATSEPGFHLIGSRVLFVDRRLSPVQSRRAVGTWLLILAGMVFVTVILGGATRLTGSGLSMVHWQVLHVLPPLSDAEWGQAFADYQQSPQGKLVNAGMDLAGFKGIFWLEYVHRAWDRIIGFAFLIPFLWFLARGQLGRRDAPRLFVLFVLGGLQGVLGWAMVASGLVDRPEVSHYLLAAHLLAALAIYAGLLWSALLYLDEGHGHGAIPLGAALLRRRVYVPLILVCVTMAAGALVAGLKAGMIYNTFPLMGGQVLPADAWALTPLWRNVLDNPAMVQFDHRCLAILTWAASVSLWWSSWGLKLPVRIRQALAMVPVAATIQAALGIATLLDVVPLQLAVTHQAGAFLLFTALVWALFTLRGPAR